MKPLEIIHVDADETDQLQIKYPALIREGLLTMGQHISY
jgi:hypothetical protein